MVISEPLHGPISGTGKGPDLVLVDRIRWEVVTDDFTRFSLNSKRRPQPTVGDDLVFVQAQTYRVPTRNIGSPAVAYL